MINDSVLIEAVDFDGIRSFFAVQRRSCSEINALLGFIVPRF